VGCRAWGGWVGALLISVLGVEPGKAQPSPTQLLKVRSTLEGTGFSIRSVGFTADGKTLAAASVDGIVTLWDVASGKERATCGSQDQNLQSMAMTPDGKTLAVGYEDQTVQLWDTGPPRKRSTLKGHRSDVISMAFSHDGKFLVSLSRDGAVKAWDVSTGKEQGCPTAEGHFECRAMALAADGKTLACGQDGGKVKLWDVGGKKVLVSLQGTPNGVLSLAFSGDGKKLAVSHADHVVKVWEVVTGKEVLSVQSPYTLAVALTPDGRTLAAAQGKAVCLWDVPSGKVLVKIQRHTEVIDALSFTPDGKNLASGSRDGTVRLWDIPKQDSGK
jgi:WD40 repeat protein